LQWRSDGFRRKSSIGARQKDFRIDIERRIKVSEAVSFIAKEDLVGLLDDRKVKLIDVRLNWETSQEKIKNAVYENPNDVAAWAAKYPKDLPIVLYCSTPRDKISLDVARYLMDQGFTKVNVLRGGWAVWTAAGLPVQKRTPSPTPKGFLKDVLKD
jgi:rhodanese-related sulfurtransferase